ncbi:MAG: carboxypeptidase-like regulatory domain-containing protein [Marinicella sp.]
MKKFIASILLSTLLIFPIHSKRLTWTEISSVVEETSEYLDSNSTNQLSDYYIEKLEYYDAQLMQLRSDDSHIDNPQHTEIDILHVKLRSLLTTVDSSLKPFGLVPDQENINSNGIIRGRVDGLGNSNYTRMKLYRADGSYQSSVYLDDAYRFKFEGLSSGHYFVLLNHNYNYVSQFNGGVLCEGGLGVGCDLGDLIPIILDENGYIDDVDFTVIEKARIQGRLVSSSGNDLSYGRVYLYDENEYLINTYYLNGDDEYSLVTPGAGNFYIKFAASGHASELYNNQICFEVCSFDNALPISVGLTGTKTLPDVTLSPNQAISGTLKEYQTLDIIEEYTTFHIVDSQTSQLVDSASFSTLDNGTYRIDGIPPGNYYMKASAGNHLAQMYSFANCSGYHINFCNNPQSAPTEISHNFNSETTNIHFRLFTGGTIKGLVKNESGEVVSYTRVKLYNQNGNIVQYDDTSYDGRYSFSGLGRGNYYISAYKSGYLNTLYPSIACPDSPHYEQSTCSNPTVGTSVYVSNAGEVAGRDLVLKNGSIVTGVVRNTSGTPISNAQVRLFLTNNYPNYSSFSVNTDSQGQFELSGITSGQYYLVAGSSKYQTEIYFNKPCIHPDQCPTQQAQILNINGISTYNNYMFSLAKKPVLTVNLLNQNSDVGGYVYIYDSNGNSVDSRYVYSSTAEFTLQPGSYYLMYSSYDRFVSKVYGSGNCFDSCNPTSGALQAFTVNNNYTINMSIDQKFMLTGTLKDLNGENLPRGYKSIVFYQNNQEVFRASISYNNPEFNITVPFAGITKVGIEFDGFYRHFFNNVNCNTQGCGLGGATAFNSGLNQEREINFRLKPIARIQGQVKNYQGEVLANHNVELLNQYGNDIRTVTTDENGNYSFNGIAIGEYYIKAIGNQEYESAFNGNVSCGYDCSYQNASPINIGLNANQVINISLKRKGIVNITNAKFNNGSIATNSKVRLKRTGGGSWTSHYYVDQNGDVEPIYLLPGEYVLTGQPWSSNDLVTFYDNIVCEESWSQTCEDQATKINVGYGSIININDFKLHSLGEIQVNVTEESTGSPLSNRRVSIYSENYSLMASQDTNSQGEVMFKELPTGNYYIYADYDGYGSDPYFPELYNGIVCPFGVGISCLISDGDLVLVDVNQQVSIHMTIKHKPKLKVNVLDSFTNEPIDYSTVRVFDPLRNHIANDYGSGTLALNLDPGFYYVTASKNSDFNTKGYPNAICESSSSYNPFECDATIALVEIPSQGGDVEIDIALDYIGGVQGYVLDRTTKEPLEGIIIDSWYEWNGSFNNYNLVVTDEFGKFRTDYYFGRNYVLGTDIPSAMGYMNQLYEGVFCPNGPAIAGLCDLSLATRVVIPAIDNLPTNITFELYIDLIFDSGFE